MGTIADKLNLLQNTKSAIKTAIIDKGQPVADSDPFSSYAGKIAAIQTGVDTSDATATAADILTSKTAYVDGELVTGTMPNRGTVVTTLNNGDVYNIQSGYYEPLSTISVPSLASVTSGTATTYDIAYGKTAYVNGIKRTGSNYCTRTYGFTGEFYRGSTTSIANIDLDSRMFNFKTNRRYCIFMPTDTWISSNGTYRYNFEISILATTPSVISSTDGFTFDNLDFDFGYWRENLNTGDIAKTGSGTISSLKLVCDNSDYILQLTCSSSTIMNNLCNNNLSVYRGGIYELGEGLTSTDA